MKKKDSKKRKIIKRLLKWGCVLALLGCLVLGGFVMSVYWGFWGEIPSYETLKSIHNAEPSTLYSGDGKELGKYYIEYRKNVDFSDISENARHALIATEDCRFEEHNGIDVVSLLRVFFKTFLGGDLSSGGGSTLSQQLAKNLFPRDELGINFMPAIKLREMLTAYRLEKIYNKEQILTFYLNTVNFGGNIYGIESAAQTYFSVKAAKLTIPQAATLVGMLKGPSRYNPRLYPERAISRRNTVITRMVQNDFLSEAAAEKFKATKLNLKYSMQATYDGLAPWLRERIRLMALDYINQYNQENGTSLNLYTDGLNIRTTLDSRLQAYAEKAVKEQMKTLQKQFYEQLNGKEPWDKSPAILENAIVRSETYQQLVGKGLSDKEARAKMSEKKSMIVYDTETCDERKVEFSSIDSLKYYLKILHAGLIAVEPKNSKIKAWVGGLNFKYFQYDQVTATRQVGSVFKPIVYAAAIHNGARLDSWYENKQTTYKEYDNWTPRNSDNNYSGVYTLKGALTHSINTIAVEVLLQTGIEPTIEYARTLGIEADLPPTPSLALGVANISLLEMIRPYSIFASGGKSIKPYFIEEIKTTDGKIIFQYATDSTANEAVVSNQEVSLMTDMLCSVVNSGTGRRLRSQYNLTNEIAGKTGTTQNQADGWFIGFTPTLVVGTRVGAMDMSIHFTSTRLGQAANTALPIYAKFMQECNHDADFASWNSRSFPITVPQNTDGPIFKEKLNIIERIENSLTPKTKKNKDSDKGNQEEKKGFFRKIGDWFKK